MKPMRDETTDLLETLRHTVSVIITSSDPELMRIAIAYREARALAVGIGLDDEGSARPRIVACLERFKVCEAANDVTAAGWMLAALQERIDERNLPFWRKLKTIADEAGRQLSPSGKTALN